VGGESLRSGDECDRHQGCHSYPSIAKVTNLWSSNSAPHGLIKQRDITNCKDNDFGIVKIAVHRNVTLQGVID
jgi:hypothetical protein